MQVSERSAEVSKSCILERGMLRSRDERTPKMAQAFLPFWNRGVAFSQFVFELMLALSGEFEFHGKLEPKDLERGMLCFQTAAEGQAKLIAQPDISMVMLCHSRFCLVIDENAGEIELDFIAHDVTAVDLFHRFQALSEQILKHLETFPTYAAVQLRQPEPAWSGLNAV